MALLDPIETNDALLPDVFRRWFASRGWTPRVHQFELLAKAEQGRSVSALVAEYLRGLADQDGEFARLEALRRRVQAEITHFRAGDRLSRDEVHDRALR